MDGARRLCADEGLHGVHVLFPSADEARELEAAGLALRVDRVVHFFFVFSVPIYIGFVHAFLGIRTRRGLEIAAWLFSVGEPLWRSALPISLGSEHFRLLLRAGNGAPDEPPFAGITDPRRSLGWDPAGPGSAEVSASARAILLHLAPGDSNGTLAGTYHHLEPLLLTAAGVSVPYLPGTTFSGDSVVLVSACMSEEPKPGAGFFPLTVDYREKAAAAGKFPGGRRPQARGFSQNLGGRVLGGAGGRAAAAPMGKKGGEVALLFLPRSKRRDRTRQED